MYVQHNAVDQSKLRGASQMCTQVREGEIQMPVQMVKSAPDGPLCS